MQEFFITVRIEDTSNEKGYYYSFPMLFFKVKCMKYKYMTKSKREEIISNIVNEKVRENLITLPIDNILAYLDEFIDVHIHELKEEDYKEIIIS